MLNEMLYVQYIANIYIYMLATVIIIIIIGTWSPYTSHQGLKNFLVKLHFLLSDGFFKNRFIEV